MTPSSMTKTEGGILCVYVILLQPESQVLLNLRTQFPNALCNSTLNSIFYHHVSWRLSKTAMKDALPFPLPLTAATQLSASLHHPFHQYPYHNSPLLSDLRYRQHSTKPLPTNLMACSLALKCASSTHTNPLEILFPFSCRYSKCHQFSKARGRSLQPSSPATFALHKLILLRLLAVPTAFAGYLESLSYVLELLFNLSHISVLTISNLDYWILIQWFFSYRSYLIHTHRW